MKKIILTFIALFATIVLSTLDAGAQGIQMMEIPEYVRKDGQNFKASFLLTGSDHFSPPEINPPRITVLEGDYIEINATSCSFSGRDSNGYIYNLQLEIAPACDFGDKLNCHFRLYFELEYDERYEASFWTEQPGLSVGSVSPSTQNILFEQASQRLTYSSNDISSIRTVQWQRKVGFGSWTDIPGATQYSYYPGSLSQTTEFRVCAATYSARAYTAPVIVNVSPLFVPGRISGNQTVISGYIPATITSSVPASGGSGPITYQWQSKSDDSSWVDIIGATSATYQPPVLTATTLYRRKATSGTKTVYSNTAMILMKAPIVEYLSFKPVANVVSEEDRDNRTRSLKTYEKMAVLGGDTTAGAFVGRAFYYDYRGHVIQTVEKNHLGGISRYSSKYDFAGNVLKKHEQHSLGQELSTPDDYYQKLTEFTYDHRGRLLTEQTTLNGSEPATITYMYDQLGRFSGKAYGPSDKLETITLDRLPVGTNIRGWTFRRDRASTSDVVYAPGFFLYPAGVVRLTATNGLEIEAYTEDEDWIWSSMTVRIGADTRSLMTSGTWLDLDAPDHDTFTIPDDKDYIVTANNLPTGDWGWGFDRIVKVGYAPNVIAEAYDYNIQGWQTGQQICRDGNSLFESELHYYDPQFAESASSYTGNITEWSWRQGSSADEHTYAFTYDSLSRLTDTKQYVNGTASDRFVEKGLTYDRNGNIQTLQRTFGGAASDSFTYNYTGNQLISLSGTTTGTYSYDTNGNMTADGPNNLNLTYNSLNLTEKVMRGDTILVKYSYLSDGTKLSATNAGGNGLYYLGSLVYKKQNGVLLLESASFGGGRILAAATTNGVIYSPQYHLTDHLGSVRAIVNDTGEVIERNDYYPFGLRWNTGTLSDNRYRYNGKEMQSFVNVPYTDYGARMSDPRFHLGWNGRDPLSEKYYPMSPYAFCGNNPVKYIDTDGRKIVDTKGNILYQNGKWTNAAKNTDAMRAGNAMMKTNIGRNTWNEMAAAAYDITINIHPGAGPKNALGTAITTNKDDEILKVNINIYEGSIAKQVDPENTSVQAQQLRSISEEDRIGAVSVHEGTHAVDKTPGIDDKSKNSPREKKAYAAQKQHIQELKRQQERHNPIILPSQKDIFPSISVKPL